MPELMDSGDAWEKAAFMRGQEEPATWAEHASGLGFIREERAEMDAAVERLLREKYEPLVSAEDYARLREKCGLGALIEGGVPDA